LTWDFKVLSSLFSFPKSSSTVMSKDSIKLLIFTQMPGYLGPCLLQELNTECYWWWPE
jgi:hypothetical protein